MIALLIVPGSQRLLLDGLPLASKVEFGFFVGLICLLLASQTVEELKVWLTSISFSRFRLISTGLFFLVIIKFLTFLYVPLENGFEVCYRSLYAQLPVGHCEKSYDQPFVSDGILLEKLSAIEKKIDFGPNSDGGQRTSSSSWNLPFKNDWGRLEPLWLERLPFSAEISGQIDVGVNSQIPVSFLGDLVIEVDGRTINEKHYIGSPRLIYVPVSRGLHVFSIKYSFIESDDFGFPEREPERLGDYATLRVYQSVPLGYSEANTNALKLISASDSLSILTNLFLLLLNQLILLIFVFLAFKFLVSHTKQLVILIFFGLAVWSVVNLGSVVERVGFNRPSLIIGLLLGVGLWLVLRRAPELAWLYGGMIGLVQFFSNKYSPIPSHWWNVALFRQRDSDWFAYEGLARTIFTQGSLEGGEKIFYFQPAMRYLIFVGHIILGNNDYLMPLLVTIAFYCAFTLALSRIKQKNFINGALMVLSVSSVVILFSDPIIHFYIVNMASELPTWIFLFTFLWLSCSTEFSVSRGIFLGLIAGLSVNFRPNQSPGWIYLVFVTLIGLIFADQNRSVFKGAAWLFVFVATISGSLSLLHNLYYGRAFVLFSTSGAVVQKNSWKIFFDMFFDSGSRQIVFAKFRDLLLFSPIPFPRDKYWSYSNSFQQMHVVWLVSLLFSIRVSRTHFKIAIFALIPLIFLVPMVVYDSGYFPRHLVIINLSFLFSAVLMLFNAQNSDQAVSLNN